MPADIFIGIGSNLGDRSTNLLRGVEMLRSGGAEVTSISGLYETEPRECMPQPNFINAVIRLSWDKSSTDCLQFLLDAEASAGRVRHFQAEPRVLDMDLLFYGSLIIKTGKLVLPHPRLHLRRFVLVPFCEIAPNFRHPIFGKTIAELLDGCTDTGRIKKV